jgi:gas vesicle protein
MKLKDLKNFDKSQLLDMLGLEQKSSTTSSLMTTLGLVGLGAIVGAGVALFLAPMSGRELRDDISRRLKNGADDALDMARDKIDEQIDQAQTRGA